MESRSVDPISAGQSATAEQIDAVVESTTWEMPEVVQELALSRDHNANLFVDKWHSFQEVISLCECFLDELIIFPE